MEKLIKFLNERMEEKEKIGPKLARFTSYDGINKVFNLNNGCCFGVEFVLSKRFEFIKWLLDNNKIDLEVLRKGNIHYWSIDEPEYETLLMVLAVEDNPITVLLSILK